MKNRKLLMHAMFLAFLLVGGGVASQPAMVWAAENEHAAHGSEPASHGADEAGGANPLALDPDLAIWTGIVFVCLLVVLRTFAWGPIVRALDAREQGVLGHLASAEAKHKEAQELLSAHEAKLAVAKQEVREMLEEARRDAEATKTQILAEADAAANAHRDRALRDIDQARDGAVRQLAETSANLAIDLAGKVVRQNLNASQQAELVRDAISKLSQASPSKN